MELYCNHADLQNVTNCFVKVYGFCRTELLSVFHHGTEWHREIVIG